MDVPPAAKAEGDEPKPDAPPAPADATAGRLTPDHASSRDEDREPAVERIPTAEELGESVLPFKDQKKEWKKQVAKLTKEAEQRELTARELKELDLLNARIEHLEVREQRHRAAVEHERAQQELQGLEKDEREDRAIAKRLKAEQEDLGRKNNEILTARAEKLKQLESAKAVASAAPSPDSTAAPAVDADAPPSPAVEAPEPEALQKEVSELNAKLETTKEELETCGEALDEIKVRVKERRGKMRVLKERVAERAADVIVPAAFLTGLAMAEAKHEESHSVEVQKEAEQRQAEQEAQDAERDAREKLEDAERNKFSAKRALKTTGRTLGKTAIVGTAVGAFGFFGGFQMIGRFFKTWALRISQPHRFIDDAFKKFTQETAEPPKGKGAILGTISAGFWLFAGDAPFAPHDVSTVKDRY